MLFVATLSVPRTPFNHAFAASSTHNDQESLL